MVAKAFSLAVVLSAVVLIECRPTMDKAIYPSESGYQRVPSHSGYQRVHGVDLGQYFVQSGGKVQDDTSSIGSSISQGSLPDMIKPYQRITLKRQEEQNLESREEQPYLVQNQQYPRNVASQGQTYQQNYHQNSNQQSSSEESGTHQQLSQQVGSSEQYRQQEGVQGSQIGDYAQGYSQKPRSARGEYLSQQRNSAESLYQQPGYTQGSQQYPNQQNSPSQGYSRSYRNNDSQQQGLYQSSEQQGYGGSHLSDPNASLEIRKIKKTVVIHPSNEDGSGRQIVVNVQRPRSYKSGDSSSSESNESNANNQKNAIFWGHG